MPASNVGCGCGIARDRRPRPAGARAFEARVLICSRASQGDSSFAFGIWANITLERAFKPLHHPAENPPPQDATLLVDTGEHGLRPLTRLSEELQTATWELIRHIEEHPNGKTVEETVGAIKEAIANGWQERAEKQLEVDMVGTPEPCHDVKAGRNGNASERPPRTHPARPSGQLGSLCRWAGRLTNWDPEAIALADDDLRLKTATIAT